MNKSFGLFEIKELNEEKRTFKGTASTINPDRSKDIMVPGGATFALPLPLLFHHDKKSAIGHVTAAKVTDKGIEVELHIPQIEEEGALKQRVDEAFQSLKYGLVKGLSVGFVPDWEKIEFLKSGGLKFEAWEWVELSLVTIPDNRESGVKEYEEYKAALGNPQTTTAGDSAEKTHKTVKLFDPNIKQGGVKLS